MLNLEQELSPNEYFSRNIWATFQSDPVGVQTRQHIGVNRLMWGSDYPHGDSTWPESRPTINFNFQGVEQRGHRRDLPTTPSRSSTPSIVRSALNKASMWARYHQGNH